MARTSIFDTNELKEILHKFFKDNKHKVMRLTFSNLAAYASQDLGISNIRYYHFARNEEINKMVEEYNQTLKSSDIMYTANNNLFTTLNIKEFVKNNLGNAQQLTFYLTQLQENQKKLYDQTIDAEFQIKKLQDQVRKLTEQKEKYRNKNKELSKLFDQLKEKTDVYIEALNLKDEKQLLKALHSTKLVYVINENDEEMSTIQTDNIQQLDETNGKDLEKLMEQYGDIFS
ncbi:hypothetical protein [Paenibacillus validus]